MDTIAGLRALRALSVAGNRETIGSALAEACLTVDDVLRAEVFFLPDISSPAGVPMSAMLSLRNTKMPVVITADGAAGSQMGPNTVTFVPLIIGNNILATLKLEGKVAFGSDAICSFELLASYAAALMERSDVARSLQDEREKARLAELELRLSWDRIPAHAWHCKPDGRLVGVNQVFASYFGLTEEDLSEYGYTRIFHPDDFERVIDVWTRAIANGEPGVTESRMVQADGTSRSFLIRVVPIRDDNGEVIRWYGINTDVEDLKVAQREIARTAAALEEAQKLSHTGSWTWRSQDEVFACSDECARIFGLVGPEPLTFHAMLEQIHHDDRTAMDLVKTFAHPSVRETQAELRVLADGTIAFVECRTRIERDALGKAIEYVGTVRDITESKLAQDRLQESERRYAATLSSIGDAVISADAQGRVAFLNPVAEGLTGWSIEDAVGRPVPEILTLVDELAGVVADPVSELLRRNVDPAHAIQYELRTKAGSERIIEASAAPIVDVGGESKGSVIVFRDMTQRNEIAEALRRSNDDLARMARLTAVGELAVSIAHEMNQPLMAIVTNAAASRAWLLNERPDIAEAVQAIESVVEDGHRAGDVLNGIMTLARNARPKIESLSLRSVIEEVLQLTKSELRRRGVAVRVKIDGDANAVNGDRVQLQQVLINLIINGADAMTGSDDDRRILRVATEGRSDGLIQVSVSDKGFGLAPGIAERVFDSFFTTKTTGTGMGLSICRSIIEAHGGRIWVTSKPSVGSTFSFTLQPPPSLARQSDAPLG